MKAAVLILELKNGDLQCVCDNSVLPLIEVAKAIRVKGEYKKQAVKSGIIICTWKPMPTMKFRCETDAEKAAKVEKIKADKAAKEEAVKE